MFAVIGPTQVYSRMNFRGMRGRKADDREKSKGRSSSKVTKDFSVILFKTLHKFKNILFPINWRR